MKGLVSLVGAGPGNPDLITVLGKKRLNQADIILYDRLVNSAILVGTKADKIYVGKSSFKKSISQTNINHLLADLALQGKRIVRLKSGDPYVFGRGGEEAFYLKRQGVNFEIIPGLTSAIAGLTAAGIPVTDRNFASSFHVITGHHKKGHPGIDWENIAHQEGTLIFLMGMGNLDLIVQKLLAYGKSSATPAAVIQWATFWKQKTVFSTLLNIEKKVKQSHLGPPALIVIGKVVNLKAKLASFSPLQGLHILAPFQKKSALFDELQDKGASLDFFARDKIKPISFKMPHLEKNPVIFVSDFLAFYIFLQRLLKEGFDYRHLSGCSLIAADNYQAKKLKRLGFIADKITKVIEFSQLSKPVVEFVSTEDNKKLKNKKIRKIEVYKKRYVPQEFDFKDFQAVILPNVECTKDLFFGCNLKQQAVLKKLPCYVWQTEVFNFCKDLKFNTIIKVKKNKPDLISTLKRRLKK